MIFLNPYMGNLAKIETLQRWIMVHSYIYYELNTNVVSDNMYDKNVLQLLELRKENKELWKRSVYKRAFRGYDGSTGFDLYHQAEAEQKKRIEIDAAFVVDMCK